MRIVEAPTPFKDYGAGQAAGEAAGGDGVGG